jgi:uncharacterized protein DUF6328
MLRYREPGGEMAELKDKIQNALDEGRMLVLGSQVLLGFQFRAAFEPGFQDLPRSSQFLKLSCLALMLIAIGLLLVPGAYHRIVEDGEDTERQHVFTTRVLCYALLPIAVAFGIDLYVSFEKTVGPTWSVMSGLAIGLCALFFWYGLELIRRSQRRSEIRKEQAMETSGKDGSRSEETKLKDKIRHVLTEARVVLPGAQALLGFQFITTLTESFEKLPSSSKYVHLISLFLVAVSIILLMTPAAYHRIVEEGENTEHFHNFTSRVLVFAMIPLALGMCGDFFVVMRKVVVSSTAAIVGSAAMLCFFYGLWFGSTIYRRKQLGHSGRGRLGEGGREFAS